MKTTGPQRRVARSFEDLVIVLTLVSFAIAQTVYDLLASNPDFLSARHVSNLQLLLVVVGYGLLPAIVLAGAWIACRRLSPALDPWVFSGLVFCFSLLLSLQIQKTYLASSGALARAPWIWIAPSAALGWLAWRKQRAFRSFLLALSPAILIFPALFLFRTWHHPAAPPSGIVAAEASTDPSRIGPPNGTPVFLLVFDEFTVHVLLNEQGKIDPDLYPTFAKLAQETHWFRNNTSNSSKTITAISAIVTGKLPEAGEANHRHYPNTIFSLLAPYYDVYIEEVGYTHFCDSEAYTCLNDATGDGTAGLLRDVGFLLADRVLPENLDIGLPDTSHTWGPFQRADDWTRAALARSQRVLNAVDALGKDHFLFFSHLILPHSPYALTPDGQIYTVGPYALDDGQDAATLASLVKRYHMQVRYVDRWLGQFIERLKQRGLYDPALLIVTGDHGVSWKAEAAGRELRENNGEMLLTPPLFIKLPFEKEGSYSERDVQHIDLLPTIADVVGMPLPFAVEGRSVLATDVASRLKVAYGEHMERFEFGDRLGLQPIKSREESSPLVGRSIDTFKAATNKSIRGRLEGVQIAPADTPGFAAGVPILVSGWALRMQPGAASAEIRSETSHSGDRSLLWRGKSGGILQRLQDLEAGKRYQARAWARAAPGSRGHLRLRVRNSDEEVLEAERDSPAGAFQELQLSFRAPEDGLMRLELHYEGGPGTVYWDDVSVKKLSAESPAEAPGSGAGSTESKAASDGSPAGPNEWVVNGGFEDESPAPWSIYGEDDGGQQDLEVAIAVNGEIVATTRPGAERWDIGKQLLNPGARYLRCGWAVSIPTEQLREGENAIEAYVLPDPARRTIQPLDSGWPRVLVKTGSSIDRKLPPGWRPEMAVSGLGQGSSRAEKLVR